MWILLYHLSENLGGRECVSDDLGLVDGEGNGDAVVAQCTAEKGGELRSDLSEIVGCHLILYEGLDAVVFLDEGLHDFEASGFGGLFDGKTVGEGEPLESQIVLGEGLALRNVLLGYNSGGAGAIGHARSSRRIGRSSAWLARIVQTIEADGGEAAHIERGGSAVVATDGLLLDCLRGGCVACGMVSGGRCR